MIFFYCRKLSLISKYHYMALHFLANLCQDYYSAKVWKLQTKSVLVVMTNRNASWCSKIGKNVLPYSHFGYHSGGVYFRETILLVQLFENIYFLSGEPYFLNMYQLFVYSLDLGSVVKIKTLFSMHNLKFKS